MEIGKHFANLASYNQNMALSLQDKLFFLEHLPHETGYLFVDFGCADGTLIDALYHMLPKGNKYLGFDISETMIDLARTKMTSSPKNVKFTADWEDVQRILTNNPNEKKVLILSSVVHEVYSYGMSDDIEKFWKRVLYTGFDYICVRDMMVPSSTYGEHTPNEWLNNIRWDAHNCVPSSRHEQFILKWGSLEIKRNALHYLLKYRWQINWEREVRENYFPVSIEDFLDQFVGEYNLDYFQRFRIPFLDECIKKDFGIEFGDNDSTHIKVVFSKKTY